MEYGTKKKSLILPDYGRNIQNMVDHCVGIADRAERNRCANTLIGIMGIMFPHLRDISDYKHILWDHLAIMSDFKLDVDYPYPIVRKEDMHKRPPRMKHGQSGMSFRHYGKLMEQWIWKAKDWPNETERALMIRMLANHMKKSFLVWNKDSVDDRKILKDLHTLSDGAIRLDERNYRLTEVKELQHQMRAAANGNTGGGSGGGGGNPHSNKNKNKKNFHKNR